jgi:2-polyprenyl-3-methyl-5-hydroxy-6-metoxy-1,4-benzoquinol methylase
MLSILSSDMVPALKQRFAGDVHVRIFHANQEDHVKTCAALCYDVVVMVNVLEHIENDQAALNDMHRLLRPATSIRSGSEISLASSIAESVTIGDITLTNSVAGWARLGFRSSPRAISI